MPHRFPHRLALGKKSDGACFNTADTRGVGLTQRYSTEFHSAYGAHVLGLVFLILFFSLSSDYNDTDLVTLPERMEDFTLETGS